MVDTAPLVDQLSPAALSVPVAVVVSATSTSPARTSFPASVPASSNSELLMVPVGLSNETIWATISGGHLCHLLLC